jgi:hypothetical protein
MQNTKEIEAQRYWNSRRVEPAKPQPRGSNLLREVLSFVTFFCVTYAIMQFIL